MNTNQTAAGGLPAAFNVTSGVTTAGAINLRSNIFANTQTTGNQRYAIYSGAAASVFTDINYNDYYTTGINIGYLTSARADIAAWRTATGKDASSYSTNPNFTSATDLKPNAGSYLAGTPITGITTDYDGVTRGNPPSVGAYEGALVYTWTGLTSTDWALATNWNMNLVPVSSVSATIPSVPANQPHITSDPVTPAECNSLTINGGASLTINAGKALTVSGTLTNSGTLTVKSDATGTGSLITASTPAATVERFMSEDDYHYISSPVAAQNISTEFINTSGGGTLPSDIDFYTWDETQVNSWINIKQADFTLNTAFETTFGVCKGYVYANSSSDVTKNFTGTLNVGDQTFPITNSPAGQRGWNLIGNPFASSVALNNAADATNNLLANNATVLNDTWEAIYLWNQTTPNTSTHTSNDYITVNHGVDPVYLAPGQAFMVAASSASAYFSFPQAARKHGSSTFYKSGQTDDVNRFWLTVGGPQDAYNETMIAMIPNTTDGMDAGYDAKKLKGNANIALYTNLVDGSDGDYAIQSINQLSGNFVVPVGLDANVAGNYAFKAGRIDNLEAVTVQLEDRTAGTFTTLNSGAEYTINVASAGRIAGRFFLHLKSTVGIDDPSVSTNNGIYSYGNVLYVQNPGKATLEVYTMSGQRMLVQEINSTGLYQTSFTGATGYYVVRLTSAGNVRVAKIFVK
jgi:hypothetical protein